MRAKQSLLILAAALVLILPACLASAAPIEHLVWGQQLQAGPTACPSGTPLINVVQKIQNTVDSGTAGNYWAYDDLVRQIQVVQTGEGSFCATVKYQGSFTTIAGASPGAGPGGTTTVGEGVVGTFEGGYTATFTGTLKATPGARTKGSIGSVDYACDATGNCPGYVDWLTYYFESHAAFSQPWWGWTYHGGNNGAWINAITGNSGDITGN